MWIMHAIASTVFLSLSSVFLKHGARRTDASIVTALRTFAVVTFMWIFVISNDFTVRLPSIGSSSFLYIFLTGIAFFTALLCFNISLKNSDVTRATSLKTLGSVLMMAAACFVHGYTENYYLRIICMVLITVGILFAIAKKSSSNKWLLFGILSAVAILATYILGSEITAVSGLICLTLILTVVLIVSLIAVFIRGIQRGIGRISASELMFILLSGVAAALSWFCFRTAIYDGDFQTTLAIIGASVATSAAFGSLFLKEKVTWKTVSGILLTITGTLVYIFAYLNDIGL